MKERDQKLLYKLIELRNRDQFVFGKVKRLASRGGELRDAVLALDERLKPKTQPEAAPGGGGAASPPASLAGAEWEEFCASVKRSAPLRELFSSDVWRSTDEDLPRVVATLAEFADLTPDPKHACRSEDEAFMGALEDARKKNVPDAAALLVEILADLIGIISEQRDIASKLYKLAATAYWRGVLKRLETGQAVWDDLPGEAAGEFRELLALLKDVPPEVRANLFRGRRMSQRVAPALFRLAWESQAEFDRALHSLTDADIAINLSRRRQRQAEEAIKLLRAKPDAEALLKQTEREIGLRFEAAQHLLGVRERVKRDALVHGWPEAGLLAMSNFEALKEVENFVLKNRGVLPPPTQPDPAFLQEESQALYELCRADARLVRFLRLIPYFSEMDIAHLAQGGAAETLRSEAEVAVESRPTATTPGATTTAGTTATTATTEMKQEPSSTQATDGPEPSADARPITSEPQPALSATIHILRPVGEHDSETKRPAYECGFSLGDEVPDLSVVEAPFSPKELLTTDVLPALRIPAEGETLRYLAEVFDRPDAARRVRQAGRSLFEWLYALFYRLELEAQKPIKSFDHFINDAGKGGREVRLFVNTNDERVAALPWEWLALSSQPDIFSFEPNCFLIRSAPGKIPEPPGELSPLKILAVASGPNEQAQARAETKLRRVAGVWEKRDGIQVRTISGVGAYAGNFIMTCHNFEPHVIYLETHVVRQFLDSQLVRPDFLVPSYIPLGSSDSGWLEAGEMVKALLASEVQLVVFGDNPTGGFDENPLLGLVFELMKEGLPAALVPTRPTQDGPSVKFLNNFFGAWLSGQPLEASVAAARDSLRDGRGDWSAYALFARGEALPKLRVPPPVA